MEQKLFNQMSQQERTSWLSDFQQWYAAILPQIEQKGVTGELFAEFECGLHMMEPFAYCRAFVQESLRFKDYGARRKLLRRYADKVATEVQGMIGMMKTVDLNDPNLLTPHVGRPTKDEQAARQLQAEKERQEQEEKEQTLFGKKSDIPVVETPDTESVSGSMGGGTLLRLDEIKWLLSPALQEAVETVRDLRNQESVNATSAKLLAEQGKPESEVAFFAEQAIECKKQYENIYEHVDSELAHVYVRLKEDTTYIAKIQAAKADPQEWRTKLRVYWDKFDDQQKATIKQQVIDDIKRNDPEQAKIREAEEKKKKEIADLIKYLTRKDKLNTPRRVKTMEERYQQLVELAGEEEAKHYYPVLEAARKDAENYTINNKKSKNNEEE